MFHILIIHLLSIPLIIYVYIYNLILFISIDISIESFISSFFYFNAMLKATPTFTISI